MTLPFRLLDIDTADSTLTGARHETAELRFFTICARNFLPAAEILFESVRRHHPNSSFTVYLCDRDAGYDPEIFGFDIAPLERLGIPEIEAMIQRYNITELCTAIKPFCFLSEFSTADGAPVVYLDPDIELFGPLDEVKTAFRDGAALVLTPHILNPAEYAEHNDQQYLRMGIYNLGFAACRQTHDMMTALHWWGRRMVSECVIDLANGLFVDQKWADLLPAFVDDVRVLRHPGYNIAYWNLQERRIQARNGDWTVNGEPLRFVHYSGIKVEKTDKLSRHSDLYTVDNSFGYGQLVKSYRERLGSPRNQALRKLPYAFFWEVGDAVNLHTPGTGKVSSWRQQNTFCNARQIFSLDEMQDYLTTNAHHLEANRQYELSLIPEGLGPDDVFRSKGYCFACGKHTDFVTSFLYSTSNRSDGRPIPNWREHVACETCRMPNRVRAALHLFLQEFDPEPTQRIYITEHETKLHAWLKTRFPGLVGSEFFGPGVSPGAEVRGIRNENMECLSFEDQSFDHVLSFDVLEHVTDAEAAFSEAYRVLAPGGHLFFTAPAHMDRSENEIRAEMQPDGAIRHLMTPEYHGNPVDPEGGALCFRYYSWQMMDDLARIGFRRPFVYQYWSRAFGYLGPNQMIFVAQKPE